MNNMVYSRCAFFIGPPCTYAVSACYMMVQATCSARHWLSSCRGGRQWSRHSVPRGSKFTGHWSHMESHQTQQRHCCDFVVSVCH